MNIEHIEESYRALESDSTLQNLIAQDISFIIQGNPNRISLDIRLRMNN